MKLKLIEKEQDGVHKFYSVIGTNIRLQREDTDGEGYLWCANLDHCIPDETDLYEGRFDYLSGSGEYSLKSIDVMNEIVDYMNWFINYSAETEDFYDISYRYFLALKGDVKLSESYENLVKEFNNYVYENKEEQLWR